MNNFKTNIVCLGYAPQYEEDDTDHPHFYVEQLVRNFPDETFYLLPDQREAPLLSAWIEYREDDPKHVDFCQNFVYNYDIGQMVERSGALVWDEVSLRNIKGPRKSSVDCLADILPKLRKAYQESDRTLDGFLVEARKIDIDFTELLSCVYDDRGGLEYIDYFRDIKAARDIIMATIISSDGMDDESWVGEDAWEAEMFVSYCKKFNLEV